MRLVVMLHGEGGTRRLEQKLFPLLACCTAEEAGWRLSPWWLVVMPSAQGRRLWRKDAGASSLGRSLYPERGWLPVMLPALLLAETAAETCGRAPVLEG